MIREDYGENCFVPPCGHKASGSGGQIPANQVATNGAWKCPICGLEILITGPSPVASDNWADAEEALVSFPDGRVELMPISTI